MKSATVSDLKNQLSKFLRYVKQGEVVLVLDRGVAIAEIQPRNVQNSGSEDRLAALEAKGMIHRGDTKLIEQYAPPSQDGNTGVLEALLEERQVGR